MQICTPNAPSNASFVVIVTFVSRLSTRDLGTSLATAGREGTFNATLAVFHFARGGVGFAHVCCVGSMADCSSDGHADANLQSWSAGKIPL